MTVLRTLVDIASYILRMLIIVGQPRLTRFMLYSLLLLRMVGRTEGYGFRTGEQEYHGWTDEKQPFDEVTCVPLGVNAQDARPDANAKCTHR